MNHSDSQSPWDTLRAWPEHRPIAACLDLAPDAPNPGVVVGQPVLDKVINRQPTIEELSSVLEPNPAKHQLLWLAYDAGLGLDPGIGSTRHQLLGWRYGEVIGLSNARYFDLDSAAGTGSPHRTAQYQLAFDSAATSAAKTRYIRSVRRVLDYIRAGDVYQVNLTHRLRFTLVGSPRALAADLFESARPWHGAYIETTSSSGQRQVIVSASPELFLDHDDETRRVCTRPMKGTRPATIDHDELFHAVKDRAELNMIVDLMRNDLGRVCSFGSIDVLQPRTIEKHGDSVLQATATVSGELRPHHGLADLIKATFPPGSVTGTPKIRAMQIIDELESAPRGPYCGTIGTIDHGRARLNVAIRTVLLTETNTPGVWDVDYPVGAGIVAESDPEAEWQETLDKADILLRLVNQRAAGSCNTPARSQSGSVA